MGKKQNFDSMMKHYGQVNLAKKMARTIVQEEKLYRKWYREVKNLTNKIFKGETHIERNGQELEITVLLGVAEPKHEKSYRRFMDAMKTAFPYCYPTQKSVETKSDGDSQIAFSISIPEAKVEKKKSTKKKKDK
jgi:hypothetical protein